MSGPTRTQAPWNTNVAYAESAHRTILTTEICDLIIDELHHERPSLLSCSLVCKSWVKPARRNLFNIFVAKPSRGSPTQVADFLSGTPAISRHVKVLVLYDHEELNLRDLIKSLTALPRVSDLELVRVNIIVSSNIEHLSTTQVRPIRRVSVKEGNAIMEDLGILQSLLSIFSEIDHLGLSGPLSAQSPMGPIRSLSIPRPQFRALPDSLAVPKLRKLTTLRIPLTIVTWLLQKPGLMKELRQLFIVEAMFASPQLTRLGSLLVELVGSTLERFRFVPGVVLRSEPSEELPDIRGRVSATRRVSSCTELNSLELCFSGWQLKHDLAATLFAQYQPIIQLAAPSLRTLILNFAFGTVQGSKPSAEEAIFWFSQLQWEILEDLLLAKEHRETMLIILIVPCVPGFGEGESNLDGVLKAFWNKCVPRLMDDGRVQVSISPR
ncbi:hypothetical protein C8Q74DRAFT_1309747 [Fomes fomentarius]|nr:hypothetical protein C8Q74DRAFT_1309747 [Fomes fomentarius]